MKKAVLRPAAVLLGLCAVYLLLLLLANSLPNAWVETNARNALIQIDESEGLYPDPFDRSPTRADGRSMLDNYTDRIMLQRTIRTGSAFEASVGGYSRYWHGYIAVLRPLLAVFSYVEIRFIAIFAQMALLCAALYLLATRLRKAVAWAYLFSWCAVFFVIFPLSLQYACVPLITNGAVVLLLWAYEKPWFERVSLPCAFLAIGSLVAYFDLWTFPLVTLGLPLTVLCALDERKNGTQPFSKGLRRVITLSVYWALGYMLTYAIKWVLSDLLTQEAALRNAIAQLRIRLRGGEGANPKENYQPGIARTLMMNLRNILSRPMALAYAAIFLGFGYQLTIRHRDSVRRDWLRRAHIFVIALYPFAWYIIFENHSQMHNFFTYRCLVVTMFAGLVYLIGFIRPKEISPPAPH